MKSERVVSNPENHGWEPLGDGRYIWASGRNTGHIVDGDTEGQITTWHDASNAWTPSNHVIVDSGTGKATFSGNVGIGVAQPTVPLDVDNPTGKAVLFLRNAGTEVLRAGGENGDGYIRSTQDMHFETGGSAKRMTIDVTGNVGIGTDSPSTDLHVRNDTASAALRLQTQAAGQSARIDLLGGDRTTYQSILSTGDDITFVTGNAQGKQESLTIDASGNVGIGMSPLRQASEAKEQLEDWKSAIEERMKAEPKADRSAVTQEITGFDKLPTLEETKERLERAAGDRLQVNGDATFSGGADRNVVTFSAAGKALGTLLKLQNDKGNWNLSSFPSSTGTTFDIYNEGKDESALKFDSNSVATFSGTVNAAAFFVNPSAPGSGYGFYQNSRMEVFPNSQTAIYAGTQLVATFKSDADAIFSGNIYKNNTTPVLDTRDLIETLATLRASTLDETVDVRQALASACDKLIEKFESMQEVATQEIEE